MKTRNELCNWLKNNAEMNNSCWVVINGSGASLCRPEDVENLISTIMGEEYADDLAILNKGEEYADFASIMSADEYDGTDCFVIVKHQTAYGQENMDIQVQYWA